MKYLSSLRESSRVGRSGWRFHRRKRSSVVALTLALALSAAACGGGNDAEGQAASAEEAEELSFRWAWSLPDDSLSSETTVEAIKSIESEGAERISIKTYPNSTLVDSNQAIEAVQNGSVEVATASLHRFGTLEPALTIDNLPYVLYDTEHVQAAVNGEFGAAVGELMAEHGVKLLGWTAYGRTGELANTVRPIEELSDMRGLRMRANGALWGAIYKKFGAQGFEMSSGDVYTALQNNTLDGGFSGINSILERDWAEVADYITAGGLSIYLYPVVANLDWWNDLSDDQQELITQAVKEAQDAKFPEVDERYAADVAAVKEVRPEVKVTMIEGELADQWRDDLSFVVDMYLEEAGENGQMLLDAYESARP
jgi:TRAP-type C4-dicarboxylate transport system substrate-binding protein